MSRILPPKETGEPSLMTSFRIPKRLYEEIGAVSEQSGHSRTDVMVHFLQWALQEWKLEQKQESAERKKGGK